MLVVEDEFELYHCGNMSTYIKNLMPSPPLNINITNSTNMSAESSLTTDLATSNGHNQVSTNEVILDISKYHLMSNEYDAMLLLNDTSLLLSFNDSNQTNFTFISDYNLNIKTQINRYRKKPDHCHNFFEGERDYLPCHNSRASGLQHSRFARVLQTIFICYLVCCKNLVL